jgi:hypothetical protein
MSSSPSFSTLRSPASRSPPPLLTIAYRFPLIYILCTADVSPSQSKEIYLTVVPIDGAQLQDPLVLEVRSWNRVVAMHDRIRDELRMMRLVSEPFRSSLEILPLRPTLTMIELREQSLAALRTEAFRRPEDLPVDTVATFFHSPHAGGQQDLPKHAVHFLVWLPPADGQSL